MKIDEACIDNVALRVISEIVAYPCERTAEDEYADHSRLLILGAVRGVLDMAEAMKEALKA